MTYTHAEYVSRDEYERTANNEQVQVSGASASDQLHEAIGASVVAAPQHPPDPPEVKEEDNNNPHVRYIVDQEEDDDLDDVVDDEELDQVFVAGAPVVTTGITGTGKGDQQLQLTDAEEQPEQQKRTAYTLQKTILGGEVEEFYKQIDSSSGPTWLQQLASSCAHPFNVLLVILAVIGAATNDFGSFGLLIGMVSISIIISFVQERQANISAQALKSKIAQQARVRRPATKRRTAKPAANTLTQPQDDGSATESDGSESEEPESTSCSTASNGSASGNGRSGASSRSYTVHSLIASDLVPGDLVVLSVGSLVPADIRLIEATGLLINQTILTGESLPVEKTSRPFRTVDAKRTDGSCSETSTAESSESHWLRRPNLAFMGSSVECGSGIGLVLATGRSTYFGRNAADLQMARPQSAFNKGVRQVSFVLMGFTLIMLPLVIVINGLTSDDWVEAALFGAAVAVGITPAMLPMIVNGNLSLAAHRLSKQKCLVKRLEAIQNLGAVDVLCTDKTGTLTNDHVTLHGHLDIAGVVSQTTLDVAYTIAKMQQGFKNVLDHAIVGAFEDAAWTRKAQATCADVSLSSPAASPSSAEMIELTALKQSVVDEPSTGGVVAPAYHATTDILPSDLLPQSWGRLLHEQPFDFQRRRMSVIIATPNETRLFCKGALAEVLRVSTHVLMPCEAASVNPIDIDPLAVAGELVRREPLTPDALAQIHAQGEILSAQGLRIVAVAARTISSPSAASYSVLDESGLTLVGLLTFLDAPKPSAKLALQKLNQLGLAVKVLTGDNPLVARQVCSELGIDVTRTLTGDDMAKLTADDDDPALQQLFFDTVIFSQLTPHDKARVVRCLRFRGSVVGFLGDGVNDGLALRESDVGISVDTGAELAKDAADIILTEKDLNVLGHAVSSGRLTHANSIKYIKMAASSNFGNVVSLLFAAAWLPFLPIYALQLLTQNLLYDISQIAIPFDTMDEDYLLQPKKWSGGNLASFMVCIGPVSSIFDITTFMIAYYYYGHQDKDDDHEVSAFQTMWFMVGLMTQTLIVHMIRTEKVPFIESRAPNSLIATTVTITAIGFIIPYVTPLADLLSMVSPPGSFFGFLAAIMVAYAIVLFGVKKAYIRMFGEWL